MKNGGPARPTPLVDWAAYGRMHALRGEIWQLRLSGPWALLDARRLAGVARDRGVRPGIGPDEGVERLWLLGWLKADLVRTEPNVDETTLAEKAGEGLLRVGEDGYGRPLYADARTAGRGGAAGRVGGLAKARMPEGVAPLFHAFRYANRRTEGRALRLPLLRPRPRGVQRPGDARRGRGAAALRAALRFPGEADGLRARGVGALRGGLRRSR